MMQRLFHILQSIKYFIRIKVTMKIGQNRTIPSFPSAISRRNGATPFTGDEEASFFR